MDQVHIYRDHAALYDRLVGAEDFEGRLAALVVPLLVEEGVLVDVGTGTGRVSRLFLERAGRILGIDAAPAMLEVARAHRERSAHPDWQLVEGDARALPVPSASADLVVAGWVFGHFRAWLPEGWRDAVDAAVAEMRRVARPGAPIVIIETLGTNHETPRTHEALDVYFEHLEGRHGFARQVIRTDYRFESVASAAATLGAFFGDAMAEAVRARGDVVVPECTGVWIGT